MVILVFKSPDTPGMRRRTVLRQLLKDAAYETSSLTVGQAGKSGDATSLIRLIKAATIDAGNYPPSRRTLAHEQRGSIEAWENEGGSMAVWPRCPIV